MLKERRGIIETSKDLVFTLLEADGNILLNVPSEKKKIIKTVPDKYYSDSATWGYSYIQICRTVEQ